VLWFLSQDEKGRHIYRCGVECELGTRANYSSEDGETPTRTLPSPGFLLVLVGDDKRGRGTVGTAGFPQLWTEFHPAARVVSIVRSCD